MIDTSKLKLEDFTPTRDNVFIKPIRVTERNKFERPQNDDDKQELGIIIAVGPQVESMKAGHLVLFNKYSYWNQELDDGIIVREEDVAGYLDVEEAAVKETYRCQRGECKNPAKGIMNHCEYHLIDGTN